MKWLEDVLVEELGVPPGVARILVLVVSALAGAVLEAGSGVVRGTLFGS